MGIVIIGTMALYLLLAVGVVYCAIRYAKKNGKSAKRWGWSAALVMYLIPFWDWIPTVVVHQYYCAKDSGFWVYKTLDEWKAENPGALAPLRSRQSVPSARTGDANNFTLTNFWNAWFNSILKKEGPLPIYRWRWEQQVVDVGNGDVLARHINFSTGDGRIGGEPESRFWLHSDGCPGSDKRAKGFVQFATQFKGMQR